eukprot:CAMPEP_0202863718 /NCGR_PEP_ID=MMETSP1391-20130828/4242_1 /ASSEMBLY_ACC=CAM_ASM_000867 /TAXON_ID=1034604 /ORGANISM="Chlamydomonas leiostraca, Strain SAG 11-49" /LENGTH=470 /DNA_ID=CAMNT_0049543381 /DNA_START=24 /DNA_END=1433 /DNA_ORIENTATION=+
MTEAAEYAMFAVIMCNAVVLMMVHYGQSHRWDVAISAANACFTGIFIIEMVLKWIAVGIPTYFTADKWNVFDFFIVCISIIGVGCDFGTTATVTVLPLLRMLRVVRVVKLARRARNLRIMVSTLVWSAPAIFNIGSVLFLVMFIYAIAGMTLFGNVKLQANLDQHANFQTFPSAMLMMFRMLTGENWNAIMWDCMIKTDCIYITEDFTGTLPDGDTVSVQGGHYLDSKTDAAVLGLMPKSIKDDQCSPAPALAVIYFLTYMLIATYLLVNMVVGIIIDNIQNITYQEDLPVTHPHLERFVTVWEELDPHATGFIHINHLGILLEELPPPLGVKGLDNVRIRIQDTIMNCDIPSRTVKTTGRVHYIHFLETLHALAGRVAGTDLPLEEEYRIHAKLLRRLPKDEEPPKYTAAHVHSAIQVACAIRAFMHRKRLAPLWHIEQLKSQVGVGAGIYGISGLEKQSKEEARAQLE